MRVLIPKLMSLFDVHRLGNIKKKKNFYLSIFHTFKTTKTKGREILKTVKKK